MSKFILKFEESDWNPDTPDVIITHEFSADRSIDAVLENVENFLRSSGFTIDGKLEIVTVEDRYNAAEETDDEDYEINVSDDIFSVNSDTQIKGDLDSIMIDTLSSNWPLGDNMISSIKDDRIDEITIKIEDNNDQPIHFRV